MNVFEYVRKNVNIIELSEKYGIKINRHKKALCLWHNDNHPSMSFKNNYFKCFSCGVTGSAIDLVQKLYDLTPIQAVKKINNDFGIGLDLKTDYKPNMNEIREKEEKRSIINDFEEWTDKTYSQYSTLAKFYSKNIIKYRPVSDNGEFDPHYVEALHRLEHVNYILDVLLKGTDHDKIELYKELEVNKTSE